jgi:ABC-2 type transport system ATP-binding protein
MDAIIVEKLKKEFQILPPNQGTMLQKAIQYFHPQYQTITAVNGISFTVKPGERVAFIGPNGAGKSTTIKMLTGIMHSTSGKIEVLGLAPAKQRKALAYQIGAVFGQRSQLWYHLPVQDTFSLLAAIYHVSTEDFQQRLTTLTQKFQIAHLLTKPVRQLSLGERMRCEIVASFLHKPTVLFLDEPTIGLDSTAKAIIRDLIRKQSEEEGLTLLLTSHDTDDIEKVCDRVIIIDQGELLLDDSLNNLKTRYIRKKVLKIVAEEESVDWNEPGVQVLEKTPHRLTIEIDVEKNAVQNIVSNLLTTFTIKDLTIEDPPLETIIENLYLHGNHTV